MDDLLMPPRKRSDVEPLIPNGCCGDVEEHSFDLPKRSLSTSTLIPRMYFSWHDVYATIDDEAGSFEEETKLKSNDLESNRSKRKQILDNVYGVAQPGEILAIMGASGAGKTTLLNVLAQRNIGKVDVHGSVKVNGLRVDREYMRKVSAYVQQEDYFIGSLTVLEHLRFTARLRMSDKHSIYTQIKRVDEVMCDLGLDTVANTIIGTRTRKGLSGGEKKRLAFASEIITNPPILLCDEPTSGLDAFLAFQVVSILKKLAREKGMTIVFTIHQPSSQVFEQFDKVYLMAEGRVAFAGTQSEAESMWRTLGNPAPDNFNPSDHYISSLAVVKKKNPLSSVMRICDHYNSSQMAIDLKREAKNGGDSSRSSSDTTESWRKQGEKRATENVYHANWCTQFVELFKRSSKTVLREPMLLRVQAVQSVILAVLTGVIFVSNTTDQQHVMSINGALFEMVCTMAYMFQYSCIRHFHGEMNAFFREHSAGLYRVSTYFLSKNVAELPWFVLYAILYAGILYWMSGLVAAWDAFVFYVFVAILVQNIAISIGYTMACSFESIPVAMAIVSIFITPIMAVGGFFINPASMPAYFLPIKYLSYFGYAFESLAVNEWTRVDVIEGANGCLAENHQCYNNGTDVLSSLSFSPSSQWPNVFIMLAMIIVVRFMAYSALLVRTKLRK